MVKMEVNMGVNMGANMGGRTAVSGCTVDRLGCGAIGCYQPGFFSGYNPCGRSVTHLKSVVTAG